MATKYKFTGKQMFAHFEAKSWEARARILWSALGIMEYHAGQKSMYDCVAEGMNFWKSGEDTYILEDYAQEIV